jgi:hypothetical protein
LAPAPRRLKNGEQWNVFLSCRSVNRPWVINLYDVLREQKHEMFLDQVAVRGGFELRRQLQEALVSSQSGVLVWSKSSVDSD